MKNCDTHDMSDYVTSNDRCGSRLGAISSFFHRNGHECDGNRFAANEHALPIDLESISMSVIPHPGELYLRKRPFRSLFISEWMTSNKKFDKKHQLSEQVRDRWSDPGIENVIGKDLVGKGGEFSFLKDKKRRIGYCDMIKCSCLFHDNVNTIDLSRSTLHYIPPCFSRYTKLEHLDLHMNVINKIERLDTLHELKDLDIENNKIKKIEGLKKLINLTNLYISSNNITNIEGLNDLVNLERLYLNENEIIKVEGLDNLANLKYLSLNDNEIKKIEGLDALVNLKELYLERNEIEKLENLDNVIKLRRLNLSRNKIKKIEGLDALVNLKELYLDRNKIEKFEGINNLVNLKRLYVWNNKIKSDECREFKKSSSFDVMC